MIDELFELIVGEEGLIVTLRCDNKFDEEKYFEIKQKLEILIFEWNKKFFGFSYFVYRYARKYKT